MKRSLTALAALSILPLGGCVAAAVGAVGAAGVATVQERSVGQAIDDATTSSEIKTKLISRGGYGEVDVEVAGGLVLLSGRVMTPEQRVRAEEVAWSSSRTDDVANEIQIEPPGGFRANASDAWITTKARTSLTTSRKVRGLNFNIETYNGVVYLMGIARSQEELNEAARRVSYIKGVNQVVSYVQVREPVAPPPAEPAPTVQAISPYQVDQTGAYSGPAPDDAELAGGAY